MEKKLSLQELNNVAEIDIVYRKKLTCKISERPRISSSTDAYEILMHYWDDGKIELIEQFKVLFLNQANRVLQILSLSQGGLTGTVADPRLILGAALRVAACSIVLCHNHPSGNLQPSRADETLSQKIKNAAAFHDIKVLDHLIIAAEGYYSFADQGLL
ncbi:MAG: JAB domain-containing protein [Ginsengibacter sp.]